VCSGPCKGARCGDQQSFHQQLLQWIYQERRTGIPFIV